MGSPFRSALAKLDDSVQNLEYQLGCLRGGLDVTDDQLWQALTDTNQSAAALRGMILVERPDADWNDRGSLELLIQNLEWEAQAKRDEERRKKIFELAGELDAGSVKHRFESRVAALNSLRLQAVRELRIAGTLYEQEKELPGPNASEWVHWACNLREENDAPVFADLRRDFPALERFSSEMEESYWVPGQRENEAATLASLRARGGQGVPQPLSPTVATSPPESASRSAKIQSQPPIRATESVPASEYQAPPSSDHSAFLTTEVPVAAVATTTHVLDQVADRSNGNGAAGELHASSTVNMWTVPTYPATVAPQGDAPGSEAPESVPADNSTDDLLPSFGAVAATKRPIAAWIAAGVIVLLGAIFAGTYYFSSASGGRPAEAVAHAASKSTGSSDSTAAGANTGLSAQPSLASGSSGGVSTGSAAGIQPIEGAQHQILLNMESCRRSDLENIECQGYVTNLGSEPSHVTLGGVDVVDGKGNSFNLNNIGQFNFSTGRSLSIAAGSRAKYTVKVPDKDRDARTLTVYVDVNNPHGLEFTFRNVPIAE
jgi:hypothetical protein